MAVGGVPFLTITEFVRAKVKAWALYVLRAIRCGRGLTALGRRGREQDARDIVYAMTRYWTRVDLNRIPEQEMNDFAGRFPAVAPSWKELRRKYGM